MTRARGILGAAALALALPGAVLPGAAGAGGLGPYAINEVLRELDPPLLRYRYVAPEMGAAEPEAVLEELQRICSEEVAPLLAPGDLGARIVISVAEAEIPFGEHDPAVRQQFEAYRIEDGRCIWEMF